MSSAIEGLKPEGLWKHFYHLTQTPRPSKKEDKVRSYLREFLKANGVEFREDEAGNIVAKKAATKGYENAPRVLLQGHVDMVCEKNKGVEINFETDPLTIYRDGDWIRAKDTTLGSDNGIGVAAALAVLEDSSIEHGPMEFLFTVDEETGLTGANALQAGFLESSIMLNLDSEEEGALYVGCAGGQDTEARLQLEFETAPSGYTGMEVLIGGLRGGHSGLDIHQGRGNAIKLLTRALHTLSGFTDARVARIEGGSKRNAIPREAETLIFIPSPDAARATAVLQELGETFRIEFGNVEPGLTVTVKKSDGTAPVMATGQQARLIDLLYALPHGVIKMSSDIPDLVETSTNLATITFSDGACVVGTSQRSAVASEKADIAAQVAAACRLAGFEVAQGDGYPGWKPNMNSYALKAMKSTFESLYGSQPAVKAIHAGLECGIIGEKFPSMDMISFGPTIEGAHSPDERVNVKSVEEFWKLLTSALKNIGKGVPA